MNSLVQWTRLPTIIRKPAFMNSPTTPKIDPNAFSARTLSRPLLLTLLLGLSGLFTLTASAQQLDAPDTIQSFPVGPDPWGMAFDGANIWVTSGGSNMVTELRASDGVQLGTFPAGGQSLHAVFDGVYIWVTNLYPSTVTRLRASDGSLQGTFPAGSFPTGIIFDGTNIWVTNQHSDEVTKLRASDGTLLGTFAAGPGPLGIAFDGANVWVSNYGQLGNGNTVTKLSSDGVLLGTFPAGKRSIGNHL